jgi:putative ABC transport system permease protein
LKKSPPALAARLLAALLPSDVRDEAVDELSDLYVARAERRGHWNAAGWYWRQVPGFVWRIRAARWRSAPGAERRRGGIMRARWVDLRYGVRTLRRSPGFSALAILMLALGIGANTAIFSVVRTVLLRPLPFPEVERIVELRETRLDRGWDAASFTHGNFWGLVELNRTFESVGAYQSTAVNLTGFEYPERLRGARVTADFLRVLGLEPVVGRFFAAGEDEPGGDTRLAILAHRFWSRRFGLDASIVGRSLNLNGETYTVIGVAPPGEPLLSEVDVFVPLERRPETNSGSFELWVIGRLRPGETLASAQSDMDRVARSLAERYPDVDRGMGIAMETTEEWVAAEPTRRALLILMGGVGLLLLIACVNLANLLLARSTGRARERAMRVALGADRSRVIALVLTESVLLGAAGALLGLVLASGAARVMRTLEMVDVPRLSQVSIDGWVLGFSILIALVTSVLTGLVPALRTPWNDLSSALREGGRTATGSRRQGRIRGFLVATEVALSLVLLVGAGLLARSFGRLMGAERGFRTESRVFFEVALPPSYQDEQRSNQFMTEFLGRIESLPRVESAAAVNVRPLGGVNVGMGYGAGDAADQGDGVPWASWRTITPGYFDAIGVPLVAGRDFLPEEVAGNPWRVIISQRIADELWPGESAIGRTLILWKGQGNDRAEVIGVAGNTRDWGLADGPSASVYFPYNGVAIHPVQFVVHASVAPVSLIPEIRSTLTALDANVPLENVETMDAMVGASVASRQFTLLLLGGFAVLALLLSLAGVYGVLSYTVARRRAEIGTRIVLGASRRSVIRLIVVQGMRPVALGLIAGVVGALALSRVLSSMLFEVSTADALTYAFVVGVLASAAILSCWLPAFRATGMSIASALREE